ncbi:MAG TPA: radical SAM protein [Bacteriovoracaceae bacterium]|nr:radical SAM protein [Bacteriovoracaceae bacterium]
MSQKDQFVKSSILDGMLKKASKACIPLITTFEITQNCNYKCSHCYNFDRTTDATNVPKANTLRPDEILRIIDEVAQVGALYLNFTGGESLLHPHLDDFIRRARTHHMEARLKTNGSLLTKERCEKLDRAGLAGMDVSLYGFSEYSYEKLTGKSGMFVKTIDGIKNAIEQGFNVSLSIILHRYNIDEMKLMVDFCRENSIEFQFSIEITERYDNSSGAKDFEITPEQFKEQLSGEFADVFMHLNPDKNLQCSCARTVCGISSTGEVFPCIGAPIASGNLRDKSFVDIWKNSTVLNKIRDLKTSDFKSCMTCDHIEYCNRSSGSIYSNTKEYTGCDTVTLDQARMRHEFKLNTV